jgi:hypothetical protein
MVDLLGGPAADLTTAMQEDFKEADNAQVVDLDPVADYTDGDRQGEALQQREVDMDVLGGKRGLNHAERLSSVRTSCCPVARRASARGPRAPG